MYSVTLTPGHYSLDSLVAALTQAMNNQIPRHGQAGVPQFFQIQANADTNQIAFLQLQLSATLPANPLAQTAGSTTVVVTQPAHGLAAGATLVLLGAGALDGQYLVTQVLTADTYTITTPTAAASTASTGGSSVQIGTPLAFQFLFGSYSDTLGPMLGFPGENSSETLPAGSYLQQNVLNVQTVTPGYPTVVQVDRALLRPGDQVVLLGAQVTPVPRSLVVRVIAVSAANTVYLDLNSQSIQLTGLGTDIVTVYWPTNAQQQALYGFNQIQTMATGSVAGTIDVTTQWNHTLVAGQQVYLSGTNSQPSLDGYHVVLASDAQQRFSIAGPSLTQHGTQGLLAHD
ncbi:MAG: hypothetical protein KGR26_16520, partial [Cyanobacteria bacterium REEB65]|nr:hypothetical protein [Cyanobacteria bacterium REEB65]